MSNMFFVVTLLILTLTISYVLFYARGRMFGKIAVLAVFFALSSGIYYAFDSYKGWPTDESVISGRLAWVEIVEPEAIYIWVYDDVKERNNIFEKYLNYVPPGRHVPHSYVLPYSDGSAEEYSNAKEELLRGSLVRIEPDSNEDRQEFRFDDRGGPKDESGYGPQLKIIPMEDFFNKQ